MSYSTVLPFKRSGGWSGYHRFYYAASIRAQAELVSKKSGIVEMHGLLVNEGKAHLLDEFQEKLHEFDTLSITAQIYCAMAAEALLNFYGVVRLGESFYKRNIERIGIIPKLEILIGICDGKLLPKDAEISGVIRRLSERRNSLVHPKAKEFALSMLSGNLGIGEAINDVQKSIDDMKRFFELFAGISVEAKAAVEFFGAVA